MVGIKDLLVNVLFIIFPLFLYQISSLYGGIRVSIWIFISIISYRFFLGGDGIYVNFIVISLIFFVLPFFSLQYKRLSLKGKLTTIVAISLLSSTILSVLTELFSSADIKEVIFQYILIQAIGIWMVTYFIEYVLEKERLLEDVGQAQLEQMERMNMVAQLAASMAHEIRNPLTSVKGFLYLLRQADLTQEKKRGVYQDCGCRARSDAIGDHGLSFLCQTANGEY